MVDLEKIKQEIKKMDEELKKVRDAYWKLKNQNKNGTNMKTKVELNNLKTEITKLTIDRDKKVYEYHNNFNPFAVLFILVILFGGLSAVTATSNFEVVQTETAISEVFSNYSDYIRSGQVQRLGVYIEPINGRTLNEVSFKINGCGYTDETSVGIEGEEPNIFYTKILQPNITENVGNWGQNERCLLTVEVSVIDSEYFNFEKTLTHYVGYAIPGCEYDNSCEVASFTARGYYYYDNINATGTITITKPTNTDYRGFAYFNAKGFFISSGNIVGTGSTAASCPSQESGQEGAAVYIYSPYISVYTITMNGGAGRQCSDEDGGQGGNGGTLFFYSSELTLLTGNIQMNGGNGANGDPMPSGESGAYGGDGGYAGELVFYPFSSNYKTTVQKTAGTLTMTAGAGGQGTDGNAASNRCESGGGGGRGGGTFGVFFSDCDVVWGGGENTLTSGHGGDAGNSDCVGTGYSYASGNDGGEVQNLNHFEFRRSNVLLTSKVTVTGGNGGDGGNGDAHSEKTASGGNGGDADSLDDYFGASGNYRQTSTYYVQMGSGGAGGSGYGGGASGSDGVRGGCRWYSSATGPDFDVLGKVSLENNLRCLPGSSGDTSTGRSAAADWGYRVNSTQVLPANNFNYLLPARTAGTEFASIQQIGSALQIAMNNVTKRVNNFTSDIYTIVTAENTTVNYFTLYNASNDLPIIQLTNDQSFSGYITDEYYIKLKQCNTGLYKYCAANNSNAFNISNIPTNISGYTYSDDLINLTEKEFEVYCSYETTPVNEAGSTEYICYQESFNVTNQTGLDNYTGLKYDGNLVISNESLWYDIENFYDGDWDTAMQFNSSAYTPTGSPKSTYLYINYSTPSKALNTSQYTFKRHNSMSLLLENVSYELGDCFNPNVIQFKIRKEYDGVGIFGPSIYAYCWNSTNWRLIDYSGVYEEAMLWNLTVQEIIVPHNITQARVIVDINTDEEETEYTDGVYYYVNDNVYAAYSVHNITCSGTKRDFEPQNTIVGNLSFTEIIVDMPYGNPQTVCLFPNQKNVMPVYQTTSRPIMTIINLGNETINLTTSFNYPLPSSITHGMINDSFTYNWGSYLLLNTTPQLFKTSINAFDGTQNISNYSVSAWLLTNCTNANPGETIITYEGDYVFIKEE